ncbi:MAG: Cache 3/Cache 2 fusion domain-containing protein [Syntrophobacteraceae bacterium]
MVITRFNDWKIKTKLIIVALILVLLPVLLVAALSINRFSKALRTASEEDLDHIVTGIYSMCKIQQEMVLKKLATDLNVAKQQLLLLGPGIQIIPEHKISLDAVNQATKKSHTVILPAWKGGKTTLTGDTHFVDSIQSLVGSNCSLYQKTDGDELLNVSTTLTGKDGRRAVGSLIPAESEITKTILAGRASAGRTFLVDEWSIALLDPIRDNEGTIIGALAVNVKEQEIISFREEIKGIKVGDTGYVYIIDSKGDLKVHPAKTGENILDARDSDGSQYIRALITNARRLSEGDTGTSRYSWLNPELGETQPRQKIVKYAYFRPWDWIIVSGSYEDEIYKAPQETERFILIVVLLSIALIFVLIIAFSKVLTDPITELTEVTGKIAGGDLTQRISVRSKDEIGHLGDSFCRMIEQIQDHTSNLENMVAARTRELQESKEKYRDLSRFLKSVLDSTTVYAIIALDSNGTIIEFNRGAEDLLGWHKDEVLNKADYSITVLPEDDPKALRDEVFRRTQNNGVCELEMIRVRKNGDRFPANTTVTAIKDASGALKGYVEILRDVTVRKALERELRETKEFLENIMESSVDGIVTTNLKGKITYLNRSMEKILNCSRKDVLGAHISRFYVRGIDEAREIMQILRAERRAENYEMEIRATTGQVQSMLNSLFLVHNEDGQIIGTAGIFKNMTQQKLLEAKLNEVTANLVEASKMRALGELVAGVAHEVNNPLMASQTILHVIMKNLQGDNDNMKRLELIRKCNDRIEKIVDHLKEFSRQTQPEFHPIDANQPLQNALLITEQQLLDHGISIVLDLGRDLPPIIGDANQLEQVFLNLLSNARDAMEQREGNKELQISSYLLEEKGIGSVVVSVRDTGIGIPEEHLDKVLEPFFTTKPVGKGSGLGLSLCFGIVEAHGGRLEIKSENGIGTEVRVLMPLSSPNKE